MFFYRLARSDRGRRFFLWVESANCFDLSAKRLPSKALPADHGSCAKEEEMVRNKLSLEDQLRGVKAALKSKRTPPQFRDGLRRRKAELQKKLRTER